jgi:hypothetical protein
MVAYRKVVYEQRARVVAALWCLWGVRRLEEKASIVDVIENEHPLPLALAKPVSNELEDIGFRIVSTSNLDEACDLLHALFKPRRIARVYP